MLPPALQAAWLQLARKVVANTEDVGPRFADEARRMHHGEIQERAIRGQATAQEALQLLDEGIAVMPLPLPAAAKETLQWPLRRCSGLGPCDERRDQLVNCSAARRAYTPPCAISALWVPCSTI